MPLAPPQRGFCFWRLPCVHTPGSWDDAAPHGLAQESEETAAAPQQIEEGHGICLSTSDSCTQQAQGLWSILGASVLHTPRRGELLQ